MNTEINEETRKLLDNIEKEYLSSLTKEEKKNYEKEATKMEKEAEALRYFNLI